jgi:DNA repair exonuclease SbcCD nuclease subunit
MIYFVGDVHGEPMPKFSVLVPTLNENDVVIQVGDFGCIFTPYPNENEVRQLDWLEEQKFTTVFIDGNHDNHERLFQLPQRKMFGSDVGVVRDNVFYLKRGNIYTIEGKKFLAFGGANSIDRARRTPNVDWWKEEIPSYSEFNGAFQNLESCGGVDYVIAHTMPDYLIKEYSKIFNLSFLDRDDTRKYLDQICLSFDFSKMFFGHWHEDWVHNSKYYLLYNNILALDVNLDLVSRFWP